MPCQPNSGIVVMPTMIAAGLRSPGDHWRILSGDIVSRLRAERHPGAGDVHLVLDADRHAVERAEQVAALDGGLGRACGLPAPVGEHLGEGVKDRVEPLDALSGAIDDLDRRELPGPNPRGEIEWPR